MTEGPYDLPPPTLSPRFQVFFIVLIATSVLLSIWATLWTPWSNSRQFLSIVFPVVGGLAGAWWAGRVGMRASIAATQ